MFFRSQIQSSISFLAKFIFSLRFLPTMGYPNPLIPSIRKIADNIVTVSCPFASKDRLDFGARMALFNYDGNILVWSPIPYGDYVVEALQILTGTTGTKFNVTHVFVVNIQHNMAARTFAKEFPDIKFVASADVHLGGECTVTYPLTEKEGNRVLTGTDMRALFDVHESWWDNFEFLYSCVHKNKEFVLYEKNTKMMFEGDMFMNMGIADGNQTFEQYSPATGCPEKHNPYTGWSFPIGKVNTQTWLGRWLFSRLNKTKEAEGKAVVRLMYDSWDFETVVTCHGNVICGNAKDQFKAAFPDCFPA